jgi:hypothetical protein
MIKESMICTVTIFNRMKYQPNLINFLKDQICKNILRK